MYHEFEITRHRVDGSATGNTVTVTDRPNRANTNHCYKISGYDTTTNESKKVFAEAQHELEIYFQQGPVSVNGRNGVTMEEFLAICEHRLKGLQSGPLPCDENKEALEHVTKALEALKRRTKKRMAQGVEGAEQKHV